MKFHIVRNQETAKEILNTYSLTLNELKEYNRHVRDWNKLIPGTKLKIPIINEAVEQDIIDMEPFIEDYYPRNTSPFDEKDQINNIETKDLKTSDVVTSDLKKEDLKKEDLEKEESIEVTNSNSQTIKEGREEIKNNKNIKKKDNIENRLNISYIWYQPYPVYYPIYIKVK